MNDYVSEFVLTAYNTRIANLYWLVLNCKFVHIQLYGMMLSMMVVLLLLVGLSLQCDWFDTLKYVKMNGSQQVDKKFEGSRTKSIFLLWCYIWILPRSNGKNPSGLLLYIDNNQELMGNVSFDSLKLHLKKSFSHYVSDMW